MTNQPFWYVTPDGQWMADDAYQFPQYRSFKFCPICDEKWEIPNTYTAAYIAQLEQTLTEHLGTHTMVEALTKINEWRARAEKAESQVTRIHRALE